MSRKLLSYTAIGLILGSTAIADVPKVAVDIAPVHSLVARVMDGVGNPKLVIPAGASPHEYSLRPSEAKSLQDADMVIWIGEDLAPWMENSIETLSKNAEVITLLKESETKLLEFREVHFLKSTTTVIMTIMMTMTRIMMTTTITTMTRTTTTTMIMMITTIMMITETMMATHMVNTIPTLGCQLRMLRHG